MAQLINYQSFKTNKHCFPNFVKEKSNKLIHRYNFTELLFIKIISSNAFDTNPAI